MTQPPLFSVIIPVHDRASTIRPVLDSVARQTCGDFECLVVDDGSSDGEALEAAVAAMADRRFRYLRRENGGGGAARNTGITAARGDWLAFLDSDDFFVPDKLETCCQHLSDDKNVVLYSQVLADRGVGRYWARPDHAIEPGEDVGEYLFVRNQFIQTSSIVIARETAVRTPFDPMLRKGQDLDFCLRLQHAGARFTMIDRPLAIWTDRQEGARTSRTPGHAEPLAWLDRARPLLSHRAYLGYRATVLAYYLARSRPWISAVDLARALVSARVAPKIVARHALRAYLPPHLYRRIVDGFVARAGSAPTLR